MQNWRKSCTLKSFLDLETFPGMFPSPQDPGKHSPEKGVASSSLFPSGVPGGRRIPAEAIR